MTNSITSQSRSTPAMLPPLVPEWAEIFGEDRFGLFAEFTLHGVRFVWRWIPPGPFLMGSPKSEMGREMRPLFAESPQHRVTITHGFWLGETPVTQSQWSSLMQHNPSRFFKDGTQRPVEQVHWYVCVDFVNRLNGTLPALNASLPSEAQWEYACRAGTTTAFHDGSSCTVPEGFDPALDQLGWFDANIQMKTQPVKEKRPNKWGLYDMHGQVWEWCLDDKRSYSDQPQKDPLGSLGPTRVLRGGSWRSRAHLCRAASRGSERADSFWDDFGLRLSAGHERLLGTEG